MVRSGLSLDDHVLLPPLGMFQFSQFSSFIDRNLSRPGHVSVQSVQFSHWQELIPARACSVQSCSHPAWTALPPNPTGSHSRSWRGRVNNMMKRYPVLLAMFSWILKQASFSNTFPGNIFPGSWSKQVFWIPSPPNLVIPMHIILYFGNYGYS